MAFLSWWIIIPICTGQMNSIDINTEHISFRFIHINCIRYHWRFYEVFHCSQVFVYYLEIVWMMAHFKQSDTSLRLVWSAILSLILRSSLPVCHHLFEKHLAQVYVFRVGKKFRMTLMIQKIKVTEQMVLPGHPYLKLENSTVQWFYI